VRKGQENGIALITVMLVLLLVSAMVVGMSWMVMTDQRLGGNNGGRESAFYGAEAGMEKLTADLGNTFATKGSVSAADLTTVTSTPPSLTGISFSNASGSTYQIICGASTTSCTPSASNATILAPSPYAGMQGLITALNLQVAAQTTNGSEIKLKRQVQLVAIPVFQFGVYSDSDLSFFNGPSFDFGGRVHTNGNLWLSPNSGPLYLADKVTVVGQVIRTNLENGWPGGGNVIGAGGDYSGVVSIATVPNPATLPPSPTYTNSQWIPLGLGQSSDNGPSVVGAVDTSVNPAWSGIGPYNGQLTIKVPTLSLTSTALGGITTPISLIRRPVPGELASNPGEFSQQYFSQATLRILLDDYKTPGTPTSGCAGSDMMALDGIDTSKNPVDLSTLANIAQSGAGGAAYSAVDGYWVANGKATITGCIKIEYQDKTGAFHDDTATILALGIRGKNTNPLSPKVASTQLPTLPDPYSGVGATLTYADYIAPSTCANPDAGAIIRIERVRDNPSTTPAGGGCGATAGLLNTDYWPNVLFDAREAVSRTVEFPLDATGRPLLTMQGVMNYIELDAGNLAAWFTANQSGLNLINNTGFSVYFSDRRGNQIDPTAGINARTGSWGYNDFVNLSDAANGCPNGVMDQGEDLEGDGFLRQYGNAQNTIPNLFAGLTPLTNGVVIEADPTFCTAKGVNWPGAVYIHAQEARENPPVYFRRALKVVNGGTLNLGTSCYGISPQPPCGLTIAAENPVYIQGDYNAPNSGAWTGSSVASSVAADAVTLLSDNWNDINSFVYPYDSSGRPGVQTAYRVAVIGGKGIPFPQPAGAPEDYGTDGGLHNFLRFLEDWSPPVTVAGVPTGTQNAYYKGSLVSFYYNRQAVGLYKGDSNTVYNPPNRAYTFDTNFTQGPQWLPPDTPSLRSINTIGFTQEIMPTQ
jgi:hypothetical protein